MVNRKSTKTTSKIAAPETAAPPAKSTEPAVPSEPTPVAELPTKTTKKEETVNEFGVILEELENMKKNISKLIGSLKTLQKNSTKKTRNANIKSGFIKPVAISTELGKFMGTKENELVPRNVVNKAINQYIKDKNLQVPTDKQTFVLDDTLSSLFNLAKGDVVHYFKMQTHLKNHYPKAIETV